MTYKLLGFSWSSDKNVTYTFADQANGTFSGAITDPAQQAVVRQAFKAWSAVSGITFKEVSAAQEGSADILVGYAILPTSQLGLTTYATTPQALPGETVKLVDPSVEPVVNQGGTLTFAGTNSTFYQAALHEIGHSLGLGHSDSAGAIMFPELSGANRGLSAEDIAGIQALYGPPSFAAQQDTTTGVSSAGAMDAYVGPVPYLDYQSIQVTTDSLNVATSTANVFLVTGFGNDALSVATGRNVLDAGEGSNYLTGTVAGAGTDTFFVNATHIAGSVWDTVVNFHAGDAVTFWGFHQGASTIAWADNEGAVGAKGLTLHAEIGGAGTGVNASLTLTGLTSADLGALRIEYGHQDAGDYMVITHL